jgi:phosphoenolpyruvate synthase/pyruvate phosphate dikinase
MAQNRIERVEAEALFRNPHLRHREYRARIFSPEKKRAERRALLRELIKNYEKSLTSFSASESLFFRLFTYNTFL